MSAFVSECTSAFTMPAEMERTTRQRAAIRAVIAAAGRPLLAQEVLELAQHRVPGLAIATVYRNLKWMADEAELRPVLLPGENPRYELSGESWHPHFQCRQCRRVFDLPALENELTRLLPRGFTVEDQELTLYGHCVDCRVVERERPR